MSFIRVESAEAPRYVNASTVTAIRFGERTLTGHSAILELSNGDDVEAYDVAEDILESLYPVIPAQPGTLAIVVERHPDSDGSDGPVLATAMFFVVQGWRLKGNKMVPLFEGSNSLHDSAFVGIVDGTGYVSPLRRECEFEDWRGGANEFIGTAAQLVNRLTHEERAKKGNNDD